MKKILLMAALISSPALFGAKPNPLFIIPATPTKDQLPSLQPKDYEQAKQTWNRLTTLKRPLTPDEKQQLIALSPLFVQPS